MVRGAVTALINPFPARSFRRRESDVVDPAEVDLVDDLHERARGGVLLSHDEHAAVGPDGAHPLDVGAHGPDVHRTVIDPDLTVLEDLNLDALLIVVALGLEARRPVDL